MNQLPLDCLRRIVPPSSRSLAGGIKSLTAASAPHPHAGPSFRLDERAA